MIMQICFSNDFGPGCTGYLKRKIYYGKAAPKKLLPNGIGANAIIAAGGLLQTILDCDYLMGSVLMQ